MKVSWSLSLKLRIKEEVTLRVGRAKTWSGHVPHSQCDNLELGGITQLPEKWGVPAPNQAPWPRALVLRWGVPINIWLWKSAEIMSEREEGLWETQMLLLKGLSTNSLAPSFSSEVTSQKVPGSYGEELNWRTLGERLKGQGLVGNLSAESSGGCLCSFVYFAVFSFYLVGLEQAGAKLVIFH